MPALLFLADNAAAHQEPLGCAGNGSGGTIGIVNGAFHHVGDAVDFTVGVNVPAGQCQGSNITARLTFPDGTHLDYATNLTLNPGTGITCPNAADPRCAPGPYRYIVRAQDLGKQTVETNLPNVDCRSPSAVNSVYAVGTASGIDHTGPGTLESTFSDCRNIPITIFQPAIVCTKSCNNAAGQNGQITFSGSVSNSGVATPLLNVTVSNLVNGSLVLITNITQLDPGQVVTFSGSYTPANPCLPTTDTIIVSGTDQLGSNVTSQCSQTCSNILTPSFTLTKVCVTNPVPFNADVYIGGTFTNTGNVTLTNIIINDNQPANPTRIVGPITLAPGGFTNFIAHYTPSNPCAPFPDTLTATANTICGVALTAQTASTTCNNTPPSPRLHLVKSCPGTNGLPGGVIGFTATITNVGNVPLTNLVIVNSQPSAGTPVTTIALLNPGQGTIISGTEPVPAGVCSLADTLTVTARDLCNNLVTTNASATCPVQCAPAIKVYKQVVCYTPTGCEPFDNNLNNQKTALGVRVDPNNCPAFCYRIVVTNIGNVTLTNVVVVDDSNPNPDLNLVPCGFPSTLAPGASASCIVTNVTHCSNTVNVVTATGTGPTTGSGTQQVSSQDTNTVVVAPIAVNCRLLVSTDNGATFVAPSVCATQTLGSSYIVRIVVTNSGQYALQNVIVSNTAGLTGCLPSPRNLGSLAIGATATIDCTNTCSAPGRTDYAVAVSAVASQAAGHVCDHNSQGVQIVATSQCATCVFCGGLPRICVTKEVVCDTPGGCSNDWSHFATGVRSGSVCPLFCYRIRVTNCGQENLVNVTVVDNKLDLSGCNFPTSLTVGQTATCIISDVELCNNLTNTVTATGVGALSGVHTNAQDTAVAVVLPISITCNVTVNDKPKETIPCDGQGHLITNAVQVCNTGSLPLSDITIHAPELVALGCTNVAGLRLSLLPGQCTNLLLCIDLVTCQPDCGLAFSNHIRITATVDHTLTNVCSWTRNESNQVVAVTASTECTATVECLPPPKTGCTPGFWKNCTIHWQLTGYRTDQPVRSVFGMGSCCTDLGNSSLLGALDFGGGSGTCGGAQILLRAAVAALLNASSPEVDYPLTQQEVITLVSAALQSCDRSTMIALASELDQANNLGCRDVNGNGLPCHRLADVPRVAPTKSSEVPRVAPTRQ